MISLIILAIGNLSLHFTALSSDSTLKNTIFPIIDFLFIFYLLVRAVFLIRSFGINQNLEDPVDFKSGPMTQAEFEKSEQEEIAQLMSNARYKSQSLTMTELALMVYAFVQYIFLIASVVTS